LLQNIETSTKDRIRAHAKALQDGGEGLPAAQLGQPTPVWIRAP
jgi:hypothetical protein